MAELDHTLRLEAVYYSAPIPRSLAALNVLGVVFDRIHLPGTFLPFDGHDPPGVAAEIERLEALPGPHRYSTDLLIGMLKFLLTAGPVRDMLACAPDALAAFGDRVPTALQDSLYKAFHGPYPESWHPMYEGNHTKGLAGDVEIVWRQDYCYWAGAMPYAANHGLPLLNDAPGFPMLKDGDQPLEADGIAAMLAIHSVLATLPDLPLLSPEALAEFRDSSQKELRAFRGSMLRYAGKLGKELKGADAAGVQRELDMFVKTEVVPTLDELRRTYEQPARPWYKRAIDLGRISAQLGVSILAGKEGGPALAAAAAFAPQLFAEIMARGEKRELLQRSGLTYLLKLRDATDRASDHRK